MRILLQGVIIGLDSINNTLFFVIAKNEAIPFLYVKREIASFLAMTKLWRVAPLSVFREGPGVS